MKKYYDRELEQKILTEESSLVTTTHKSRLVVITGRRRVGKTELILRVMNNEKEVPFVYLFASRIAANVLIQGWLGTISSVLGVSFMPHKKRGI